MRRRHRLFPRDLGRFRVCDIPHWILGDVVCGSPFVLLGWEAGWSENTCREGGGVTRAMWASDSREQPQAACACLPSAACFFWGVVVLVWGPHPVLLRAYPWPCPQGSLLAG